MTCMWKELLWLLPGRLRPEAEKIGQDRLLEIRLRVGSAPQFVCADGICVSHGGAVTAQEVSGCVQLASRYSAYAASTIGQGFLTAPGGHRIGICGQSVQKDGVSAGLKEATSLCIRVARDVLGIGEKLARQLTGSALILGPPGVGKTTLLRDVVRCLSKKEQVSVVDERGEIFPASEGKIQFDTGNGVDVLTSCPKAEGMAMVLRAMSPQWIAVDEITTKADCAAMEICSYCGVKLLATAHVAEVRDLEKREIYAKLLSSGIFETYALLDRDRHYTVGRLGL